MPTTIDGEFVKGVFRPLKPVVLPERYPSKIVYDEPLAVDPSPAPVAAVPQRPAPVVPDLDDYPDLGEDTYDIVAPPPEIVGTVTMKFVYIGERSAPRIPDEE